MSDSSNVPARSGWPNSQQWLGRCFKVECSSGDDATWMIYRKVCAETSQVTECVRIEARSDGAHVLYLADPIMKRLLESQTEIAPSEFSLIVLALLEAVRAIP